MKEIKPIYECILTIVMLFAQNAFSQPKFPGCEPVNGTTSNLYVVPQTPNAASLGKFGNSPVSYFTGRPNISIPIYNFKSRDITLPITLDYDAGGVLVNSLPGWAGQNWTLNAGGVVTRTVKGRPNEYEFPENTPNAKNKKSYFKSYNVLTKLWNGGKNNFKELKEDIKMGTYDLSPDVFNFNFLDKSGSFFLDSNGKWRVESDENLEVVFDYDNASNFISPLFSNYPASTRQQPKTISGFKIKDEEGNVYVFGYDRNAIEYTTNFWHMTTYPQETESWYANSWYLTK